MGETLWEEIQAQGDNLRQVVAHLYGPERPRLEEAGRFLGGGKPILFIGMGSAAYLCAPAQFYLGRRGKPAATISAAEAYYHLRPSLAEYHLVLNSRSGETVEVVKLSRALREAGIPFVALTNEPKSQLAHDATHVVWADSRKDSLVSINIVSGMMAATLVLAAAASGDLEALQADFHGLAEAMVAVVDQALSAAEQLAAFFDTVRPIYLLSQGAGKAAADCGRLALEEIARWPAVALGTAEFRQGPVEVVDHRFGCVIFCTPDHLSRLDLALARDLVSSGARVLTVGSTIEGAPRGLRGLVFPLPPLLADLAPVLAVVPIQVLACELAELQGYQPGQVRFISKVIFDEGGIPNRDDHTTGKAG